jgi:hypothetical protein
MEFKRRLRSRFFLKRRVAESAEEVHKVVGQAVPDASLDVDPFNWFIV